VLALVLLATLLPLLPLLLNATHKSTRACAKTISMCSGKVKAVTRTVFVLPVSLGANQKSCSLATPILLGLLAQMAFSTWILPRQLAKEPHRMPNALSLVLLDSFQPQRTFFPWTDCQFRATRSLLTL
jgi:hypothetical protein